MHKVRYSKFSGMFLASGKDNALYLESVITSHSFLASSLALHIFPQNIFYVASKESTMSL